MPKRFTDLLNWIKRVLCNRNVWSAVTAVGTCAAALFALYAACIFRGQLQEARNDALWADHPNFTMGPIAFWQTGHGKAYGDNNLEIDSLFPNEKIMGTVWTSNDGHGVAHIIRSDCFLFWGKEPLPMNLEKWGRTIDGLAHPIKAFDLEMRSWSHVSDMKDINPGDGSLGWLLSTVVYDPNQDLFVIGEIDWKYGPGFIGVGSTSFARRYDKALRRFVPVKNPDYESQSPRE